MSKIIYKCSKCGARGCKLWRQYQTIASAVDLLCAPCAEADQRPSNEPGWRSPFDKDEGDQIGWLVPACPTDDGKTFWGYTSVPPEACNKWNGLPPKPKAPVPIPPGPSLTEQRRAESDRNQKQWIAETAFLVESTSFEHQVLWEKWSIEAVAKKEFITIPENRHRVLWEQLSPGFFQQIGKLGKHPVCVEVQFARIAGHVVAFYDATSRVVDHDMVKKWLEETFKVPKWDSGTRVAQTNASNFHSCVHALEEQNKKARVA
jgi:hypothetical protein